MNSRRNAASLGARRPAGLACQGNPAPAAPAIAATPSSGRLYTTSTASLGGSSSELDARAAQDRANEARVEAHEKKLQEKRLKKLAEKEARYAYLMGNTVGKSEGLTLREVREQQAQINYAAAAAAAARTEDEDKRRKCQEEVHQELEQEVIKDVAKSIREIRLQQQEKYNSVMQKKSYS